MTQSAGHVLLRAERMIDEEFEGRRTPGRWRVSWDVHDVLYSACPYAAQHPGRTHADMLLGRMMYVDADLPPNSMLLEPA